LHGPRRRGGNRHNHIDSLPTPHHRGRSIGDFIDNGLVASVLFLVQKFAYLRIAVIEARVAELIVSDEDAGQSVKVERVSLAPLADD
jgi:hypothetical protein